MDSSFRPFPDSTFSVGESTSCLLQSHRERGRTRTSTRDPRTTTYSLPSEDRTNPGCPELGFVSSRGGAERPGEVQESRHV